MSASILHKEIEIDHGDVHYTVVVDAEKQQHGTIHGLTGLDGHLSEIEHQDELGKIGINYGAQHIEHIHHHGGEGNHHGLDVHIDLDTGHVSTEEHHNEHHILPLHETEHHGLKHRHILGYHENSHDLGHSDYEIDSGLGHHGFKHHELNPYDSELHGLYHDDLGHIFKYHDLQEQELEHNGVNVPSHHVIGGNYGSTIHSGHSEHVPGAWVKHHGVKGGYGVGQHRGVLWNLLPSKTVKHISAHGGEDGSVQSYIYGQPLTDLEGVQVIHHADIHH